MSDFDAQTIGNPREDNRRFYEFTRNFAIRTDEKLEDMHECCAFGILRRTEEFKNKLTKTFERAEDLHQRVRRGLDELGTTLEGKAAEVRIVILDPDSGDQELVASAAEFDQRYAGRVKGHDSYGEIDLTGALDVTAAEQAYLEQATTIAEPGGLPDVYLDDARRVSALEAGLSPDDVGYLDPGQDPFAGVDELPDVAIEEAGYAPTFESVEPEHRPPPGYEELPGDPDYPVVEDDEPDNLAGPGRGTLSGGYENVPSLYNEEEFSRTEPEPPGATSGQEDFSLDREISAALNSSRAQAQQRRSGSRAGSSEPSQDGSGSGSVARGSAQLGQSAPDQGGLEGGAKCAALRRAAEQQANEYRRALSKMDVDRRVCDPQCGEEYYTAYELYQEGERLNRDFANDPSCDTSRFVDAVERLQRRSGMIQ
jgi:hypothetical protein